MLHTPPCCFGRPKQRPLSETRERTGLALRKSCPRNGPDMSKEEKQLLRRIAIASESRDWPTARSLFGTYGGCAFQLYAATLHAAFRCREYNHGAKIYEKAMNTCEFIDLPFYNMAIRIFAKLGEDSRVQQIWDTALKSFELDEFLASARIAAAADAGDVETAAAVLDQMNSSNVSIDVYHINSAIRACWGWGNKQHRAAKYLFDLVERFQLSPTVVTFTSLIGAYETASLQEILSAYDEMKALQIQADAPFAETYIFSVLQKGNATVEMALRETSVERLRAARDALIDFKRAGFKLHRSCRSADAQLTRMGI